MMRTRMTQRREHDKICRTVDRSYLGVGSGTAVGADLPQTAFDAGVKEARGTALIVGTRRLGAGNG